MHGRDILAELEAAGVHVHTLDGRQLRAKGGLTDELRGVIRTHTAAIVEAIQRREAAAYPARGWLLIRSKHLQEVVVLVRDEQAAADAPAGYVTYTEAEIEHLRDITPDALRQVHEAKKFWSGRITSKEAGRA